MRLWGTPRLGQRPRTGLIDSLTTALGAGGLRIAAGKPWPVEVTAPAKLPTVERFEVSGKETSQYVSALLLAACAQVKRHGQPCEVAWNSGLTSEGYVTLTVDWLKQVGFSVQAAAQSLRLEAWSPTRQTPVVPVDASGLGYLLLLAWRSGSAVRAYPLSRSHPDLAMENVLLEVGLQVERPAEGQLRVLGKAQRGLRADAAKAPDLMPTLAALACVLPEPSLLDNISILRRKESDRVEGIVAMVSAVGGCVEMQAEQLKILPPKKCQPFEVDSRGDHRLAMSAACLSVLAAVPADISQPACVKKSFPGFWQQLAAIGWGVGTDD